jgi:hypothetical protein
MEITQPVNDLLFLIFTIIPVIVGLISRRHLIFHGHSQGTATKHNTHTVIFLEIEITNH